MTMYKVAFTVSNFYFTGAEGTAKLFHPKPTPDLREALLAFEEVSPPNVLASYV